VCLMMPGPPGTFLPCACALSRFQISKTMEQFEQQFEDMEVVTMTMEGTMDSTTATSTPAEDVDALIRQVADENQLELDATFDSHVAPKKKPEAEAAPAEAEAAPQDDLAARLAALRA